MTRTKPKISIVFLAMLCCLLMVAGCKEGEKEQALAEAAEAKAQLATTQVDLARSAKDKDALTLQLATAAQARDTLQEQVDKLTKSRDEAVKSAQKQIKSLTVLLRDQSKETARLEAQNEKLQATINELQNKLKAAVTLPKL